MALTDDQRGPRAAWLRRHRKARYGSGAGGLAKLAGALGERGAYRSPDTIKGWEASDDRSPIPPDVLLVLEELFGESAPRPYVAPTTPELVAALAEQTKAITALVEELRLSREARADDEARFRSLEAAVALQAQRDAGAQRGQRSPRVGVG